MVLLLTFATGCCMAIASPAYHAIVIEMVGPEDLPNAIALNSTQFQLSRVVGPSLAGVAFQVFGVAGCFFANATSFVAVVFALWRAQIVSSREPQPKISLRRDRAILWSELREGLDYVRSRPRVFMLLVICAISTLFGAPYITMIPYFAKEVHHLGETGLSVMMGTAGAGAFLGALTLVMMGNSARKGSAVLAGAFVYGVGITGFSLSQSLGVSLAFLFVLGFAIVFTVAVTNMLLQKLVTDKMRGRVLSMFVLTFFGPMPISNLVAGSLASRFGAAHTLAVGGLIITLFVLIVTVTNKRLRELS
jgi:predicted MFS family arabinose efflux permease